MAHTFISSVWYVCMNTLHSADLLRDCPHVSSSYTQVTICLSSYIHLRMTKHVLSNHFRRVLFFQLFPRLFILLISPNTATISENARRVDEIFFCKIAAVNPRVKRLKCVVDTQRKLKNNVWDRFSNRNICVFVRTVALIAV